MFALAGNIMAIATVWTHDVYRMNIATTKSESHYLLTGRLAVVGGTFLSILSAYLALRYNTMMDYLQLILSLFNAPLLATMLLGMFTTWVTPSARVWGFAFGMVAAIAVSITSHFGWLRYGSQMSTNFHGAIWAFLTCLATSIFVSLFTNPKPILELNGVTYKTRSAHATRTPKSSWFLALALLLLCIVLNVIFR